MGYIKFNDFLDNNKVKIIKVDLKKNSKVTEKQWFKEMIHGRIIESNESLEMLCDEFVVVQTVGDKKLYKVVDYMTAKTYNKRFIVDVYGLVWQNDGATFIGKFNENGVMELL